MPHGHTTQVEQRLRDAISRDTRNTTKHHHVHDDGKHRLDDPPQRTQDGLFILHRDGALHKQDQKVAIVPYFFQVHLKKPVSRLDDGGPVFVFS